MEAIQRIIIVGGGFAGIEMIKHLKGEGKYEVVLVDINNYNFFPPMLYQVASGFMEPSAISYPYRKLLRNKNNVRFRLGELVELRADENKIILSNGELEYDILIMATGTTTNFFGNKNIEQQSLPMKTIGDSLTLRNLIYTRLERATRVENKLQGKKLLTFVIAGAGPTGVELSGILSEMRKNILTKDYPELTNDDLGKVYLVDGNDAVLASMSEKTQKYTKAKLEELGVELRLGVRIDDFNNEVVYLSDGTTIESRNLIWAAGVMGKKFKGFSDESYGRGMRLKTNQFNLVEGYSNIYAIGDSAILTDKDYPNGHPQVAQVAIQQGYNLACNLKRGEKQQWVPFKYKDKGSMAIIGRNKAVTDGPHQKFFIKGFFAWFLWVFVHIMSLVNFRNRLHAIYNWAGYYINKDQSFRMIIKPRDTKM